MKKDVLQEEQRLALLLILWRIPSVFASLFSAIVSGSMVVWLEFVENASVLIPAILLAALSRRMGRDLKYQFNYGTGKLEAITAFACEVFDVAGLLCIISFSIRKLLRPEADEGNLLLALAVCVAGTLIDVFLLYRQKKLSEREHSKMLHTAYLSAKKDFAFDCISISTLLIGIVFSETPWIRSSSPVLCILMSIPFGCVVLHHLRESLAELADETLDEDSQLKLLKVLISLRDSYEDFGELRSRTNGKYKHIDVEISFPPQTPWSEAVQASSRIRERIRGELGESIVNFIIKESD